MNNEKTPEQVTFELDTAPQYVRVTMKMAQIVTRRWQTGDPVADASLIILVAAVMDIETSRWLLVNVYIPAGESVRVSLAKMAVLSAHQRRDL